MIIYIHQKNADGSNEPVLGNWYGKVAPYHASVPSSQIRHVYVNGGTKIGDVVSTITNASQGPGSIWRLMINCHGLPGEICLGESITTGNAAQFGRGLRAFMTRRGDGILVGCCYAAAGEEVPLTKQGCIREQSFAGNGLSVLMEIARSSGVKVMGALDQQITWQLNGPVLTVNPDYTYFVRAGRVEPAIRQGVSGESYVCR